MSQRQAQSTMPTDERPITRSPSRLQRLVLLALALSIAATSHAASMVVQPGDTLYGLSQRLGTTVAKLTAANAGIDELIRPGDELELPPGATHEVQSGESLAGLAERFGTTVGALMKLNALPNTVVNPGTRLLLAPQNADRHQGRADTYTVRSGDTLYDIALATGSTVASLIALNDLQGSVIQPGQELRVADVPARSRPASIVVTVDAGDTLWEIARTHDLTVEDLTRENGLAADATLRPGDRLRLPGHDSPDAHDLGGAISEEVTVGAGDSLWEIARRYDTSVPALRSANDLASDRIYAGQSLWIIPNNELHPATDGSAYPSLPQRIRWPVPGVVTSRFGYRTLRLNGSNFHNALDIDGETGEPVKAAASGVVAFSGWRGNYGNLVVVRAGNVEYRYAHNSELLVGEGQAVAAGETIARVGNTGLSFGDHVHFEVRIDGTPVDPLPLLESKLR